MIESIGAGKSTLLAALSGTTLKSHGKKVWGSVWYEQVEKDEKNSKDPSTSKRGKEVNEHSDDKFIFRSILSMR